VDHGVSTGRALLLPHGNTSPISYHSRTTSRISNVLSHRTGTRYPTTATYTRTEPLSHRTHSVQRLAASERRGLTDADAPRALSVSGSSQHGSGCLAAVSGSRLSARSSYSIGRSAVPCAALRTLPVTPARSWTVNCSSGSSPAAACASESRSTTIHRAPSRAVRSYCTLPAG